MAGTKISALTAAAALGGTEAIPGVQSAANVKITPAQIKTFVSASPTLVTPVLGVATGTSLALGGATIGSNALAVTGAANISGTVTTGAYAVATNGFFGSGANGAGLRGSGTDGLLLLNSAENGFNMLKFGVATSAGAGIKRNGAALNFRLADDSADASITAASITASTFLKSGSYTVATVPSAAASGAGARIYVSNEAGGATPAFSDATDWRRYADRAIIS